MVAFKFPDRSVSLEADYLVPLGLGDCTIANGVLQADLPLSREQIAKIEAEGFVRADTHWYEITPEPLREQQSALLKAFGERPSTTIPPRNSKPLTVSFVQALQQGNLDQAKELGFEVRSVNL